MTERVEPAPSWLTDPALTRIWRLLADRLADRGRQPSGRVVLGGLSRKERHAVSALLGRSVTTARLAVELADLDAALLARSGLGGLVAVVEAATGEPVLDRPALRARRRTDREAPLALARELLGDRPWVAGWLDAVARSGMLGRATDPLDAVRCAAAVLERLPQPTSRTELAATVGAGAHALDDGTTTAGLVLRGLAARSGRPVPATPAQRRDLWERYGVHVDLVSTSCLTLGLRGTGPAAARLDLAADAGDPVHLTPWDLRRVVLTPPDTALVCENPRVLAATAERFGGRFAVVCTRGQPTLVVLDVLRALNGSRLRYHGDFDWPGIHIASRLIAEVGVEPWHMGPADYETAIRPGLTPLTGDPVEPVWDAELGASMRHHGVAVHEEALLPDLVVAWSATGAS